MLLGQYRAKISEKGRTAFPKRFREELGDKVVLTVGYENSLMAVSEKQWLSLLEVTEGRPIIMGTARDTNRFLLGEACEIDLDEQGRFIIPTYLREHAKISGEVVFLGLNKYVEVWDKEVWEEYKKQLNENIGEIAEKLSKSDVV